jgi:RNA polymerase sigma-70 factor (sigma-E family)
MGAGTRMEAVDALYRNHGERSVRLAYLLTGDLAAAEDVVHEAFVRLLGRLRAIRDPEALAAYLKRTIVNLAKNHHRRQGVARGFLASKRDSADVTTSLPDVESRDEMRTELLGLPLRQRAALVLRYCEDLSEEQVASLLGTSPKAVRSLVGRGLTTLRNSDRRNANG